MAGGQSQSPTIEAEDCRANQNDIQTKQHQEEILEIAGSDAVMEERTVVVEEHDTLTTGVAVFRAFGFEDLSHSR